MKYIISKNIIFSMLAILVVGFAAHAFAAGTPGKAVDIEMVNDLAATVKDLLNGNVALVVDGIILAVSAYAAAIMRTPTPLIFGIMSCVIFHTAIKLFLA